MITGTSSLLALLFLLVSSQVTPIRGNPRSECEIGDCSAQAAGLLQAAPFKKTGHHRLADVAEIKETLEQGTPVALASKNTAVALPQVEVSDADVSAAGSSELAKRITTLQGKGNTSLDGSLMKKGCEGNYPNAASNGRLKLGKSSVLVENNDGARPIVIFYHGMEQTCSQCPDLRQKFVAAGYTVVSPCDHNMGAVEAVLAGVGTWGADTLTRVQCWIGNRRVGVVGYSMGGGAAIKNSYDNGHRNPKVPIVALHPAAMLAGPGIVSGPILYTTGTGEDGASSDAWKRYYGATTSWAAWSNYNLAWGSKAYLKYHNANHGFPCGQHGSPEVQTAAVKWLDCYIKGSGCSTFQRDVCTPSVKDCFVNM